MSKTLGMGSVILAATLTAFSAPAAADSSVAREIVWFQSVQVGLSYTASECNLTRPGEFSSYLSERLQAIGIGLNPDSRVVATLSVAAKRFGFLGMQCAYNVTFQMTSVLDSNEIFIIDPPVRAALDRLGQIPIVIYQDGIFGVVLLSGSVDGGAASAREKVKEAIIALVERLKAARAG